MGVLYGKYDLLDKLLAYQVRPASQSLPNVSPPGGRAAGRGNFYVWDGNYYALEVTTRLGRVQAPV